MLLKLIIVLQKMYSGPTIKHVCISKLSPRPVTTLAKLSQNPTGPTTQTSLMDDLFRFL